MSGFRAPEISVVVPAYNAQATLSEALKSVANQTFGDFECIVVDDGSTDETVSIAEDFVKQDSRFRLIRKSREGVSAARNTALLHASGRYIAFLDADDVAYSHRFITQKRFLDKYSDIALVGTNAEVFGEDVPPSSKLVFLNSHEEILPMLTFTLEFLMSSIMLRREVIQHVGMFDTRFHLAEDWEFLARIARLFRCANLDEFLVRYRRSHAQVTRTQVDSPSGPSIKVRIEQLCWLGIPRHKQDLETHIAISPSHWPIKRDVPDDAYSKDRVRRWIQRMIEANWRTRRFNTHIFAKMLDNILQGNAKPDFQF